MHTILLGAGFQIAILENYKPSSENIISEAIKSEPHRFHLLRELCSNLPRELQSLNYLWTTNQEIVKIVANEKINSVFEAYRNSKIGNFIDYYLNLPYPYSNPYNVLFVLLGLELKQIVCYTYKEVGAFKRTGTDSLLKIIGKEKVTWISFNYDLVLENFLQKNHRAWNYSFTEELAIQKPQTTEHLIIKPHGSLNVSFETLRNENGVRNKLRFLDEENPIRTSFDFDNIGFSSNTIPYEENRPWVIGYLPDHMKDEHNSIGMYSDIAHELAKINLAQSTFALEKAGKLTILCYSLPVEDQWVFARLNNLKKSLSIQVVSADDTDRIKETLEDMGFNNVTLPFSNNSNRL